LRRPVTSGVSALSGSVAYGHQAMQHVSSNPSKIPYGGFSPVRLQTGSIRRHLHRLRRLIGGQLHRLPPASWSPRCVGARGRVRRCIPVQRPLAWRRVILSRRVIAYYGLIRASGLLPSAYDFADGSLPCGRGPEGPCFYLRILLVVLLPVPRRTGRPRTIVRPPVVAFARMRWARRPQDPT